MDKNSEEASEAIKDGESGFISAIEEDLKA